MQSIFATRLQKANMTENLKRVAQWEILWVSRTKMDGQLAEGGKASDAIGVPFIV
jgi:hypothetical protein